MILTIKVIPRSSQNEVVGEMANGVLKIKVTAAPVDGAANDRVVELLANYYDVPKSHVTIQAGHTSTTKRVEIQN